MTTIQVSLHDGTNLTVDVENYNSDTLANQLNDVKYIVVAIGNLIVNKNAIKVISPTV